MIIQPEGTRIAAEKTARVCAVIDHANSVRRWHTQGRAFDQTNAEHQFGCVAIILLYHPNPSRNLIANALFHDNHEYVLGDFPATAKQVAPGLSEIDASSKSQYAAGFIPGFDPEGLSDEDKAWIKFADAFETMFYIISHASRPNHGPLVMNAYRSLVQATATMLQWGHNIDISAFKVG